MRYGFLPALIAAMLNSILRAILCASKKRPQRPKLIAAKSKSQILPVVFCGAVGKNSEE
jgi:hypothetical protein